MLPPVLHGSLLLARVTSFVGVLPEFGGQAVPRLVKVGLVFALTSFWLGGIINTFPAADLLRQPTGTAWVYYGLALVREAFLGALLGYAFGLFLAPAHMAGEFLTQELGLSFSSQVNPTGTNATGPLTQICESLAALLFFGLNGHHLFLAALDGTLAHFPLGGNLVNVPVAQLIGAAGVAEEWGILLAAPVGFCLFLTTVVLAFMTRAAPQLNLYTVGFPLRLGVGLVGLLLLLPDMIAASISIFGRVGEFLAWLV